MAGLRPAALVEGGDGTDTLAFNGSNANEVITVTANGQRVLLTRDLGAVTTFPRIAAMHKRPSTTRTGRAYVQIDPDNSQVVDVVSAVRREP